MRAPARQLHLSVVAVVPDFPKCFAFTDVSRQDSTSYVGREDSEEGLPEGL